MKKLKIKYQIWSANRAINKLAAQLTQGQKHFVTEVKV